MTERIITDLDEALALQNGCSCGVDPALERDEECVRCRTDHDTIAASLVHHMQRADAAKEQARKDYMLSCEMDRRGRAAEARVLEALSANEGLARTLRDELTRRIAAEKRVAELEAALRSYAPKCHLCDGIAPWRESGEYEHRRCDAQRGDLGPKACEIPHADVLRSLDAPKGDSSS